MIGFNARLFLGLDKRSEPYNPNSSWDKSVPQGSIPSAHLETQVTAY